MTLEFGNCPSCNAKSLQHCRSCGAALPWNKSAQKAAKSSSSSSIGLGDIAWGGMTVQLIGGLIFCAGVFLWFGNMLRFFPTFPLAGYITASIGAAIWGAGSQMEG